MPAEHHRGVDRIVAILEAVAHSPDGLTLTELSRMLKAPVSSIQKLTNGLLAVGYLVTDDRRFELGPGAFALTMGGEWSSVAPVSHDLVERLSAELDCSIVLGVLVGDHLMYLDEAGNDPGIDFYARSRSRRPILTSSGGKRLLAGMSDEELHERLRRLSQTSPASDIDQFLQELPEIRRTGLARGYALPNISAIAAGVPGRRGRLAAALVAVGSPADMSERMDEVGAALLERIKQLETARVVPSDQARRDTQEHGSQIA
jgi:DNA-binding IclR family transcriptional regulator